MVGAESERAQCRHKVGVPCHIGVLHGARRFLQGSQRRARGLRVQKERVVWEGCSQAFPVTRGPGKGTACLQVV